MHFPKNIAALVLVISLMILPFLLGAASVISGLVYTNIARILLVIISWLLFALLVLIIATAQNCSFVSRLKSLSIYDKLALVVLLAVAVYTSQFVAISYKMAFYTTGISVASVLIGFSFVQLASRFGRIFVTAILYALFVGMLLHLTVMLSYVYLEAGNDALDWAHAMPGYAAVRLYGYSVELAIATGTGLFLLQPQKANARSWLIFSGAALLWGAIFWSGGRGAMASLIVSFILASIVLPHIILRLWGFVLATMSIGAALSLLVWTPSSLSFGLINFFVRTTGGNATSSRLDMWKEAFTLFLDRPIFGHGISQYHLYTQIESFKTYPQVHNLILDALFSLGLIGGVCLLYLALKAWLKVVVRTKTAGISYTFPAFLGLNTLLAHSMLTGTYFYIHGQIYIAILFGLLFATTHKSDATVSS